MAVPDDFEVKRPASVGHLPGGRYAVSVFKGTPANIGVAWSELMRKWLPASGMQIDMRPCFELYDAEASEDAETGEFVCKLCIPVRSL